jgi:hypothetical protein
MKTYIQYCRMATKDLVDTIDELIQKIDSIVTDKDKDKDKLLTAFNISNGTHSALYFLAGRIRGFLIFDFSPS